MGLRRHWSSRYSGDLTWHLTDGRLPSRAHEKSIGPLTRQTCKKAPLPAQYTVFREIPPQQLSLSRLRKIVPEEHHLYSALHAQTSPGIQPYSDTPFPARQKPPEHHFSSVSQCNSWMVETDVEDHRSFTTLSPPNQLFASPRWAQTVRNSGCDFGDNFLGMGLLPPYCQHPRPQRLLYLECRLRYAVSNAGCKHGDVGPGQTAANFGCLTKTEQRPEFESRSHYTCGESENSNFISSVKW